MARTKKESPVHAEVEEAVKSALDSHQRNIDESLKGVPMSEGLAPIGTPRLPEEVQAKFRREDCIRLLRTMCEQDPNRVVSRNYFRVWSGINESTWNRYFGTFEEFKKQAGIKLSRQVHKLEREIAKHASVDHYRKLEEQRMDWGTKYTKIPRGGRFKTILAASDFHDIDCDPFALRVFLDVASRASDTIDVVCLAGDIWDLPEFGRWTQDPRDWDVAGRIKYTHEKILAPLRKLLPKAQIDLLEGNHEARLLRHLADATPAMRAVLSDLLGMDLPQLLGLSKYEVNYIGRGSLAPWTQRDIEKEIEHNYKVYYEAILAHHFPKIGMKKGLPGFSGHHHKLQVFPMDSPILGPSGWWQMGAMHVRDASYTDGEPWTNGFLMVHVDTKTRRSTFEYIDIGDTAWAGGKLYQRTKAEKVLSTQETF